MLRESGTREMSDFRKGEAKNPMTWMGKFLFFLYLLYPLFRHLLGDSNVFWIISISAAILLSVKYFRLTLRINAPIVAWCLIVMMALGSFLLLGSDATTNPKRITTFTVTIILMISISRSREWINPTLKLALSMLSIHAIATLAFLAFPSLYSGLIKPVFFSGEPNAIGYQSGLTSHYSYNGMLLSAGLLLALSMVWSKGQPGKKALVSAPTALAILFAVSLLVTTKRGPIIAVVLASTIAYFVASGRVKTGTTLKLLLGGVGMAMLLAFLSQFVPQIQSVFARFEVAFAGANETDATSGRNLLWARALELWKESPVIGHGWGTYRFYWEGRTDIATHSAHNVPLNLLAEAGLLGVIVYSVAVIPPLIGLWKATRKLPQQDAWIMPGIWFAFAYQIYYHIYSVSGSPLYDVESYVFFFIYSCGIWMALWQQSGTQRPISPEWNER